MMTHLALRRRRLSDPVVDSSAVIAILRQETGADTYPDAIDAAKA